MGQHDRTVKYRLSFTGAQPAEQRQEASEGGLGVAAPSAVDLAVVGQRAGERLEGRHPAHHHRVGVRIDPEPLCSRGARPPDAVDIRPRDPFDWPVCPCCPPAAGGRAGSEHEVRSDRLSGAFCISAPPHAWGKEGGGISVSEYVGNI